MLPVEVAKVPFNALTDVSDDVSAIVAPAANVKPSGSVPVAAPSSPPHLPDSFEVALELLVVAAEVKINLPLPVASVVNAVRHRCR